MSKQSFIRQLMHERLYRVVPPEPTEDEIEYGLLVLREQIENGNYPGSSLGRTLWWDIGNENATFIRKLCSAVITRYAAELVETRGLATELSGKTPSELYRLFFADDELSPFRFKLVDQLTGSTEWAEELWSVQK